MTIISLVTQTQHGDRRHFTVGVETLEEGLESINTIANSRDTLLEVYLLEGNTVLALPVEAFGGQPLQVPIQALEKEWSAILDALPVASTAGPSNLLALLSQQLGYHKTCIARFETAIASATDKLFMSQQRNHQKPHWPEMENQLRANLEMYNRLLLTANALMESLIHQIGRLEAQ